jgi:hypothetical protein
MHRILAPPSAGTFMFLATERASSPERFRLAAPERSLTRPGWIHKELRCNFVRAPRAGKRAARTEARARFVVYRPREHALRIELTNGVAIALPVNLTPDLRRARRAAMCVRLRSWAEAAACTWKAWTSTSAFPVSFPPSLPDQSGWQNSAASAGEYPPPPRLLQRAETGAEAVVRAFGPGWVRWSLDASPFRYYLMTT